MDLVLVVIGLALMVPVVFGKNLGGKLKNHFVFQLFIQHQIRKNRYRTLVTSQVSACSREPWYPPIYADTQHTHSPHPYAQCGIAQTKAVRRWLLSPPG